MTWRRHTIYVRFLALAMLAAGAAALSGCTDGTASPVVPTIPVAPTATPTSDVSLVVVVTSIPTPRPRATPSPVPTAFSVPRGPYIVLSPSSGPPLSATVSVLGGHLPPLVKVDLVWAPGGRASTLSTTAYTGPHGGLTGRFRVPASAPGSYDMLAEVQGVVYARAAYRIVSTGAISVKVGPGAAGESVRITGEHFLPDIRLLFAAYPLFTGPKAFTLGYARTSPAGAVALATASRKLVPGEWVVRVFTTGQLLAELAETYVQVVL